MLRLKLFPVYLLRLFLPPSVSDLPRSHVQFGNFRKQFHNLLHVWVSFDTDQPSLTTTFANGCIQKSILPNTQTNSVGHLLVKLKASTVHTRHLYNIVLANQNLCFLSPTNQMRQSDYENRGFVSLFNKENAVQISWLYEPIPKRFIWRKNVLPASRQSETHNKNFSLGEGFGYAYDHSLSCCWTWIIISDN